MKKREEKNRRRKERLKAEDGKQNGKQTGLAEKEHEVTIGAKSRNKSKRRRMGVEKT